MDRQDQEMSHQKHFTLRNVRLRTLLVTTQRIQPLQPTAQHSACYAISASHPLMCFRRIRILKHTAWATRLFWLAPGGASRGHKLSTNCAAVQPCSARINDFLTCAAPVKTCAAPDAGSLIQKRPLTRLFTDAPQNLSFPHAAYWRLDFTETVRPGSQNFSFRLQLWSY